MTIETKYNVGDEVWAVKGGRAVAGHIQALNCHHYRCVGNAHTRISYDIDCGVFYLYNIHEINLFPTKEELLKSL